MKLPHAERHLIEVHPAFPPLIKHFGPCKLQPDPDVYSVLVRSVISQLISTAAAKSITAKLMNKVKKLTPQRMAKLTDDELQSCGISGGKRKSIRGLTECFLVRGFAKKVSSADDAGVRDLLLPMHGVGPWTVDMFLMFGLGRPDVLPVGDLGLRTAVKDTFQLAELPTPKQLTAMAEPWQPYRTTATWYLWRSRGWVPQSAE